MKIRIMFIYVFNRIVAYVVFGFLSVTIMLAVLLTIAVILFSYQLPKSSELAHLHLAHSSSIYDRNGALLYEVYGAENRTFVSLNSLPQSVISATLSAEDANFYHHDGVDAKGMLYAAYQTVLGHSVQGGSTITQQLVKNTLLNDQRTLDRKVREAILAIQIERQYSKHDILELYLNEVPYGGQVYGIQAAAKTYFNKDAKDLTLPEAAMLAGLPQSPSQYSPFSHRQAALERQHYVLYLMHRAGYLTASQEQRNKDQPLVFASAAVTIRAPWFAMWVKDLLVQNFGEKMVETAGLQVITSLDLQKQTIAEEEIHYQIDRLAQSGAHATQASLLSLDPKTGQILAMVGSNNYFDRSTNGNVNATLAERQPGSAIKPFVYLTGFMSGKLTPATLLNDSPTTFDAGIGQPPYAPHEADGKFWGPILARDALANSRNIPTVQVMQKIGLVSLLDTAKKAGITTLNDPSRYGLSLALGGAEVRMLDLASAYGTLATGGVQHDPVAILKITDAQGNVLSQFQPSGGHKEFDSRYPYLVTSILSDNVARQRLFGPGNLLELDRPAAVKTGTTDDNRDAWTMGYTPDVVTGVWVGNFDNTPMNGIQGSTGATPIWHYYMERVLADTPVTPFSRPDGIVEEPITRDGQLACSAAATVRLEHFVAGTEPNQPCLNIAPLFSIDHSVQSPLPLPAGQQVVPHTTQSDLLTTIEGVMSRAGRRGN